MFGLQDGCVLKMAFSVFFSANEHDSFTDALQDLRASFSEADAALDRAKDADAASFRFRRFVGVTYCVGGSILMRHFVVAV